MILLGKKAQQKITVILQNLTMILQNQGQQINLLSNQVAALNAKVFPDAQSQPAPVEPLNQDDADRYIGLRQDGSAGESSESGVQPPHLGLR